MPSTSHTLYLIRHGARFDYASPTRWHDELSPLPYIVPTDPPLSPFGEEQARNTGATLEQLIQADLTDLSLSPTAPQLSLFSSLYYRVIQTALPLVHRLNLPHNLEVGLCEFGHVYNTIPPPATRAQIVPQINLDYTPLVSPTEMDWSCTKTREGGEDYMRRIQLFASRYSSSLDALHTSTATPTVHVCFSHAASSSFLHALLDTDRTRNLEDMGLFAPCGIFKVAKTITDGVSSPWEIVRYGSDNAHAQTSLPAHITPCVKTKPWGYAIEKSYDAMWAEARRKNEIPRIYHLVEQPTWDGIKPGADYLPSTYAQDGFIHATGAASDLLFVANMFYKPSPSPWYCLEIDVTKLAAGVEVKYEPPAPGEEKLYPHVYGPVTTNAVVRVVDVERDADGTFTSIAF